MKDNRTGSPVKGGNSADPIVMESSNTQRRFEIVPELFKNDAVERYFSSSEFPPATLLRNVAGNFDWLTVQSTGYVITFN
ncbi:hypothetical protein AVEN_62783-1 [Araneus ventricosus]|uniref:Uncharacterized protein n=1 Tax=Araneus ventricosus TaxID=182803 RepID=A0A4Y2RU46_ARAVE|nr:hypothetical protein AVEN_62783-1 [Araneus ventricosus]